MVHAETPRATYCYQVDAADVLVRVDPWWLAFARENGASKLCPEAILGRSLWDFIEGSDTQTLYREIHRRVRETRSAVVLPFRCDSPTLQRQMRMTISYAEQDGLNYECVLLRTLPQRCIWILDPDAPRSNAFLTMCSGCKRAMIEPYGWLEVEDAAARVNAFDRDRVPLLHYTVCSDCQQRAHQAFENGAA